MLTNEQTNILVVDDDHVTRHMVSQILKNSNYNIFEATNGKEAVELYNTVSPHIILMDVMMPIMDGYAACKEIRESSNFLELPIIMLTGLDDVESVKSALDSGATDFISKPINWILFEQRVHYALHARNMHEELQNQQIMLSQAQQIAKLGSWELSLEDNTFSISEQLRSLLRLSPDEELEQLSSLVDFSHPADKEIVRSHIVDAMSNGVGYKLEHRLMGKDGSELYILQHAELIKDRTGYPVKIIGIVQDITELKSSQSIIHHQNHYDLLTDLPNRRLFTEKVIKDVIYSKNKNTSVVVYMVTLDNIRNLSESLGYKATETILISFATRLKQLQSDHIVISRFNDSTFAIMLKDFDDFSHVTGMAEAVLNLTIEPFNIDTHEIFISVSIGISIYPIDNNSAEATILGAENAMLNASKEGGGRYLFYSEHSNRQAQERLEIENDMRKGIERGEFIPYFQPQINAKTGKITGFEALARWQHPNKGLVPPFKFIDIAEQTGLIIPLSISIFEQAFAQTKQWADDGLGIFKVGINLSIKQFSGNDVYEDVNTLLKKTGLASNQVDIEITESMAATKTDEMIHILHQFKEMGMEISIDDFGTGYSSLSHIQKFPIDTIKIDRSFVTDIDESGKGIIAKTIIAMSASLGMNVIAEGVETTTQLDMLLEHGCDNIQGYYFSKPLPASEFPDFIAKFYSESNLQKENA
ncbi:MAG: EAL domain-containing protein [Sulfuriflexus sp.]|nr:EAL domain-containing protein [Sulfuriflexus sp.]